MKMKMFLYGAVFVLHAYIIADVGVPTIKAIWTETPVDHNFRFLITLWIVIGMYAVFPLHQIIKKVLND